MRLHRNPFPLLALAGALAVPALAEDEVEPLEIGSTVPATIRLMDFEGEATSFEDLRGKVVLLHFWSYRCPAERHANPIFKEMEAKLAESEDVVLLGIVSNQNELGAKPGKGDDYAEFYKELRKKRDEVGYEHTILADHGNVVSDLFAAKSTPHCFVIDKEGVLRYSGALDDDPTGKKGEDATNYVLEAAQAVLASEKPKVETTKPYG